MIFTKSFRMMVDLVRFELTTSSMPWKRESNTYDESLTKHAGYSIPKWRGCGAQNHRFREAACGKWRGCGSGADWYNRRDL